MSDSVRLINIEAAINQLGERVRAVEVKMNIIAFLSGALATGLIGLGLYLILK